MNRLCWSFIDWLSLLLAPAEREVIRGDIAESQMPAAQALRDVLGLVLCREAANWTGVRPWLVLVAIVIPAAVALSLFSITTTNGAAIYLWLYLNNWTSGYLAPGFRAELVSHIEMTLRAFLVLACCACTAGLAIGAVARRTILISGFLFVAMVSFGELSEPGRSGAGPNGAVFALAFYRIVFPLLVHVGVVVLPAILGMRCGVAFARRT